MTHDILITRPEYDLVTMYLSKWSQEVIDFAEAKALKVKVLSADNANRAEFEKFLKKQSPQVILLNGHGTPSSVTGHKSEPLVVASENENVLNKKIVYALSCNSSAVLGPKSIEAGALAYIGYKQQFAFLTDKNKVSRAYDDEFANYFKEAANEVSLSLVRGKTAQQAYLSSQSKFKELIRKLSSSTAPAEAEFIRRWLFWDMYYQCVLGNMDARLVGS